MGVLVHLQQGFAYDLWANRKWLHEATPDLNAQRDQVLEHLAKWSDVWRVRVMEGLGMTPPAPLEGPLEERLEAAAQWWNETLPNLPLGQTFLWRRMRDGSLRSATPLDVALHLVLHGTYHRGQLRGLAEAAQTKDFPETDLIRFVAPEPRPVEASEQEDLLNVLAKRFDHTIWAWQAWESVIPTSPFPERAQRILEHEMGCTEGWFQDAGPQFGLEPPQEPAGSPTERMRASADRWVSILKAHGPGAVYHWSRPAHGDQFWSLETLATHVTNHGAYHRGHIRGLAEAAHWEAFPDTDFIFFADPSRQPG